MTTNLLGDRTQVDHRPDQAESQEEEIGIDPSWFDRRQKYAQSRPSLRRRKLPSEANTTVVGNPFTERMEKLPPPDFFGDPALTLKMKRKKAALIVPDPSPETAPTDRGLGASQAPLFLDMEVELDPAIPAEVVPEATPRPVPPPIPAHLTAPEPRPAPVLAMPPPLPPPPSIPDTVMFIPADPEPALAPPPPAPAPAEPPLPEPPPELAEAPETPAAQAAPVAEPQQKGKVILLFSCRGGAGSTTLAVNLAASMARDKEVCLVDLDLQLGDVFVALDLESKITLATMAREAPLMDAAALRRRLPRHESGVYALSQAGRVDDIDPGLVDQVPALLAKLASHFDVVLIDGVRDFGDFPLAALDAADEIALVFTQDVPAVRRAGRIIQVCRKLGYPEKKLRLILNRHTGDAKVPEDEVARALGLPILARVANDYRATRKAQDDGVLLTDVARRTRITRDLRHLAGALLTDPEPAGERKPGFLARLFGRRKKG